MVVLQAGERKTYGICMTLVNYKKSDLVVNYPIVSKNTSILALLFPAIYYDMWKHRYIFPPKVSERLAKFCFARTFSLEHFIFM